MSKVAGLNKQFSERDVQRMRNLITGKNGNKVGQSVGYSKADEDYKEGDVWEYDGRKWTIKNGIKQNITKFDSAKKAHVMPLFCPCCKKKMDPGFDTPYYNIHKKCFNCVIEFEHQLRVEGLYEQYESRIINSDIDGMIEDFKNYIAEQITITNDSFITEQGDIEKWDGSYDVSKIMKSMADTVEYLEGLKR